MPRSEYETNFEMSSLLDHEETEHDRWARALKPTQRRVSYGSEPSRMQRLLVETLQAALLAALFFGPLFLYLW